MTPTTRLAAAFLLAAAPLAALLLAGPGWQALGIFMARCAGLAPD